MAGLPLLFLGLLIAAAPGSAAERGIDLAGMVTDEGRHPLPGATVYVYTAGPRQGTSAYCPSCYVDCGKRQTTDARGRFRFQVPGYHLASGTAGLDACRRLVRLCVTAGQPNPTLSLLLEPGDR